MKITNRYSGKVFWRLFNSTDSVYITGLKEGKLNKNASTSFHLPEHVQIEFKHKWLWGGFIKKANRKNLYHPEDEITLTDKGSISVHRPYESRVMSEEFVTADYGTSIHIVDLREVSGEETTLKRTITWEVSNAVTSAEQTTQTQSSTHSFGIGINVKKKGKSGGVGYSAEIKDELVKTESKTVTEASKKTHSEEYTFTNGLVTVVKGVWAGQYKTGVIRKYNADYDYVIPVGYTLGTIEMYDDGSMSIDELNEILEKAGSDKRITAETETVMLM